MDRLRWTLIAGLLLLPVAGHPEESSAAGVQQYTPDFFQRFYPQTALDMLERLPGFSLDTGSDARGFGGSAGNVLVDGARPSTKSLDLEEVLARIPARSVRWIEVIQGAQKAGETAGQSVIANVVRETGRSSGAWIATAIREPDGLVYPAIELSLANTVSEWSVATKANYYWENFDFQDFTRTNRDASGELVLFQDESAPRKEYSAFVATEAQREFDNGRLTLNTRVGIFDRAEDADRIGYRGRFADGAPDERLRIAFDREQEELELGAVWEQTLWETWAFKAIGLGSLVLTDQLTKVVDEVPFGEFDRSSRFESEADQSELIGRFTFSRSPWRGVVPEFGFELARNELDRSLTLSRDDGAGPVPFELPNDNALVEELRGEAFSNFVWTINEHFIGEFGFAVETSQISVSGDSDNEQRFTFVKPSLALNWKPRPGAQVRFALRRTVGQLDFNDFAASAEATDDRFLAGNSSLGPDQTTSASVTVDLRSERFGALNFQVLHEWIEDSLEQVVLPNGASGLANAGDSRFWGVFGSAFVPLNGLLPGALIRAEFEIYDSEFDDPLTGESRAITDVDSPEIEVTFRQDLVDQRWSWGVFYRAKTESQDFFTDEISDSSWGENWTLFAETTRWFGLRTRLELRQVKTREFPRTRLFFDPDRSGAFAGSEVQLRERGMFARLEFSGQF
ncbi:MAG: TonB-dependent receptor [Pseudomonadota bacterium]